MMLFSKGLYISFNRNYIISYVSCFFFFDHYIFFGVEKSVRFGSDKDILLSFNNIDYEICFNFHENGCKVQNETVKLICDVKYGDNRKIAGNEIIIKNNNGGIEVKFLNDMDGLKISEIIPDTLADIVSQNFKKENIPIINSAFPQYLSNGAIFLKIFPHMILILNSAKISMLQAMKN